jgi:5,10-methylenetetrahydrofolate reductase
VQLKAKFDSGDFVYLAEMEPPKGVDVSEMLKNAKRLKGKIDAFLVPEMSNAVMRMSSLGASLLLQNKGLNAILQVCCRDRNRLALQADLLAAGAAGITHVMAVTGENPSFGDHHQTKAVYDIELIDLLYGIRQLMDGRDMAGIDLQGTPDFVVGAAVNSGLSGQALELELKEMNKKIKAGVTFFITPPLFDIATMKSFLSRVDLSTVKIIPTVLLLKSAGMARYMARNVDNVHIPDDMISRIQNAPDKVRECIAIASETLGRIKDSGFSGAVISTIGWENKIPDILENA